MIYLLLVINNYFSEYEYNYAKKGAIERIKVEEIFL